MRYLVALMCGGLALATGSANAEVDAKPIPVIFDTDICGDCDDVLALAMLHALQSRGECQLLAVTVSADHPLAAPFVDAVNTFYGRVGLPVGAVGQGGVQEPSAFLDVATQRDGDRLRYPRDIGPGQAQPAVEVLRKALAAAEDGSVVMIQVGFFTNLVRLLESEPDAISPLKGADLIKKKVKRLSVMAGSFEPIDGNERYHEYNVVKDIPAARKLAEAWPTPIVWSGFEIGIAVPYPAESIEQDYGYVEHHPVAEAYIRRNPPPHNRPTWDLTSVLVAVRSNRGYFDLSPPGRVTIEEDGFSRFQPEAGGPHQYLILKPEDRARVVEALVLLSSQPPAANPAR